MKLALDTAAYPTERATSGGQECGWIPEWLRRTAVAAWLVDPRGIVTYLNDEARSLFGGADALVLGAPCHESMRAKDANGKPFCARKCAARCAASATRVEPMMLRREDGRGRLVWFLVFFVPVPAPPELGGEVHLAHLAYPMSAYQRALSYWRSVADAAAPARQAPASPLSAREREILARLASGQDQKRIARELFLSYTTVRNHVQHVIAKLEVHSIQEAVALFVLGEAEARAARE